MSEQIAKGIQSNVHFILRKGNISLPFVVVNSSGEPDERAFRADPNRRSAIKISSGQHSMNDGELPYDLSVWDTFRGGINAEEHERDTSKYAEGFRLNSWQGPGIWNGPQVYYATGYRDAVRYLPQDAAGVTWKKLYADGNEGTRYMAIPFTGNGSWDADNMRVLLRRRGTPGTCTASLRTDDSSAPHTTVRISDTVTASELADILHELWKFNDSDGYTLADATDYWIVLAAASGDSEKNHWEIGVDEAGSGVLTSTDGTTWGSPTNDFLPYHYVTDTDDTMEALFFDYKGSTFFISKPDNNGDCRIWRNGYQGAADSNSGALDKLKDSSQTGWTSADVGGIVKIFEGPGSAEATNWREVDAGASGALDVTPDWVIEHTTATSYAVVNLDSFQEIDDALLTDPATGILSIGEQIYIAQGDAINMVRLRLYNNSGTWTETFTEEGTANNKAHFLMKWRHPTRGMVVIRLQNSDGDSNVSFSMADHDGNESSDLSFDATETVVGDNNYKFTGFNTYGEPEVPWFFKEDRPYYLQNDRPTPLALKELEKVPSPKNGKGSMGLGAELYFSLLNSFARYYKNNLDDKGPNENGGFPANQQGPFVDGTSYPGFLIVAKDGGTTGYSSIHVYRDSSWHEMYRAPLGERIRNIHYQVIPGSAPDRVWFSQGADICWLPMPGDIPIPTLDANYRFSCESMIESAWIYTSLMRVWKFYRSIEVFSENLGNGVKVTMYYKLDDDTDWRLAPQEITKVPTQEIFLDPLEMDTWGKRLKIRLLLETDDNTTTPIVRRVIVDHFQKLQHKFQFTCQVMIGGEMVDLEGEDISFTLDEYWEQLRQWSQNNPTDDDRPAVLFMEHRSKIFTGRFVTIDPLPMTPDTLEAEEELEIHVVQMSMLEV